MALLFIDGFDHYGTSMNMTTAGKWASGTSTASTTQIRTGTHSLGLTSAQTLVSKPFTVTTGFVVGAAWYPTGSFSANDIIGVREVSTDHLVLAVTAGAVLTVKRGATVLATGTTVIPINSWTYIEFKGVIHDTTGSYGVRINGVTEAALTNAGPVDTRNVGTTGQWDRVYFSGITSNGFLDDVYLCDQSGSAPRNTFLGLVKIETLYPSIGNGSNVGLTPSTGTDHGALVDETTPNTTDYNSSATVGVKDTYNYPDMTLAGTVYGVQLNLYCQKSDAAARTICGVTRPGTTDYDGAAVTPGTTFSYVPQIRETNPDGGEWNTAAINGSQFGMKVVS